MRLALSLTQPSALDNMSPLLFVAVAALLLVWRWRSDPLRGVPGPWLARWTPFWLMYHARRGERYLAVHEAHKVRRLVVTPACPHQRSFSALFRNTAP